jgi:ribA/ribD-fused uncharacterized protein
MHHKLDTETHVYFYENEFYVLSNFSSFRLHWHGLDFDTSEHTYHWTKFQWAAATGDPRCATASLRAAEAIREARSAHTAFKVAEDHVRLVPSSWQEQRVVVMKSILRAKAYQHEYVRRKLLETGERLLIEDSWRDSFWGAGADWYGLNMLGKLWMEIREELRKEATTDV